jgi:hypothetical protein
LIINNPKEKGFAEAPTWAIKEKEAGIQVDTIASFSHAEAF